MRQRASWAFVLWTLAPGVLWAATTPEEFEAKLGYQTGTVTLNDGMAAVR